MFAHLWWYIINALVLQYMLGILRNNDQAHCPMTCCVAIEAHHQMIVQVTRTSCVSFEEIAVLGIITTIDWFSEQKWSSQQYRSCMDVKKHSLQPKCILWTSDELPFYLEHIKHRMEKKCPHRRSCYVDSVVVVWVLLITEVNIIHKNFGDSTS